MKPNTLYIVPKGTFGDKNDNLQFIGSDDTCTKIKGEVVLINQFGENSHFRELNLFIQGDSYHGQGNNWIMIEHWSYNADLFFEFCEYVSNKFSLTLEIGLK